VGAVGNGSSNSIVARGLFAARGDRGRVRVDLDLQLAAQQVEHRLSRSISYILFFVCPISR
jgi:hypothetical protein